MWFPIYLFTLCLYCVSAGIDTCPEVTPVKHFNLNNDYCNGIWFEIARYNSISLEEKADCVYFDMKPDGDKQCELIFHEVLNKNKVSVKGRLRQMPFGEGDTGSVSDNIYVQEGTLNVTLNFIAFERGKYALIYDCVFDKERNTNVAYGWITSKTASISEDEKSEVINLIKKTDILDASQFVWNHFTHEMCMTDL